MIGGIDNSLFIQGLGGFLILPVFIVFLRWAFPSTKEPAAKQERRELRRSLRELKRK